MRPIFARTIHKFGEPVEVHYRDETVSPKYLTGLVQRPAADAIVNDFDMDFFTVYLAITDVEIPPSKFDRVVVRGESRGIEEVQTENASGADLVYVLRVRG
jgi:hypothetical protein